ncbi:AI-2E family transporter, partial [Mesorhizobium sp. M7A.F.Ca.CA.004.11.1.1]
VVVGFLNRDSVEHARFLVRRLKRAKAALRVGIVFWSETGSEDKETADKLARDLNADFVAHGMVDAVLGALSNEPPVALKLVAKRRMRRQRAASKKVTAAAAD